MTRPVMLITGASRGIGAATATLAAQAGYDLVLNYAQNQGAAQTLAEALQGFGANVLIVQANVAVESEVMAMFTQLDQHFGQLDVLVNNAGVVADKSPVKAMTLARLQNLFGINILGAFLCAREAILRMERPLPEMKAAHSETGQALPWNRSIINVSSVAARLGSPNEYVDYAASKGAIDTMTLGLAKELAAQGIRVNAVRPGLIDTDIHASGGQPDRVERFKPQIPMQRGGTAMEVAQTILWLASRQASYVTGSLMDVSGGR
jgi:NAD(P)-dependent dehydrogenase (short-subunit alcohol dehydrogenase family)